MPAGRARLENLPAGNWRVVVRGGGSFERSFGSLVPAEFDLSIAPGEVLRQSLPTVEGARVRLWVRSSTGAHQTARARLFDAAGREHPLSLCALEPETQTEVSGRVVLERWNEFGPLAAGDWRLALDSLWHEPLELQFRVQPGSCGSSRPNFGPADPQEIPSRGRAWEGAQSSATQQARPASAEAGSAAAGSFSRL
jgi:hypothetical protein